MLQGVDSGQQPRVRGVAFTNVDEKPEKPLQRHQAFHDVGGKVSLAANRFKDSLQVRTPWWLSSRFLKHNTRNLPAITICALQHVRQSVDLGFQQCHENERTIDTLNGAAIGMDRYTFERPWGMEADRDQAVTR